MSFGTTLRTLLEERNISQRQFAQDLNMAPSTIGNYIRDFREPDFNTLKRFANYFSVSTDFLLEHNLSKLPESTQEMTLQIMSALSPSDQQLWLEQGKLLLRLHNSSGNKTK